jgi:hypothetical protein
MNSQVRGRILVGVRGLLLWGSVVMLRYAEIMITRRFLVIRADLCH